MLGDWCLLDIETTGIDPGNDQIIDIGYLCFEGTKLLKKYSSLVHTDIALSHFISKLTGITQSMVDKAPSWDKVCEDLHLLEKHHIIAHNSNFEESFLSREFEDLGLDNIFHDSALYLSLLFPKRSTLKLEQFIIDFEIAQTEVHRGFEDSRDLLKVMLVATYLSHQDKEKKHFIESQLAKFSEKEFWFKNFFALSSSELLEISHSIGFDLLEHMQKLSSPSEQKVQLSSDQRPSFEFNSESIKKVFSCDDSVNSVMSGYQYRKSQEDLALKVGQSFSNSIHAIVQAPTGTGKTIGYLVPSLLFANKERKVLISTGTKTLQEQAMTKDVPIAKSLTGLDNDNKKVVKLIGSSNHFCELRFRDDSNEMLDSMMSFDEKISKAYFESLFFYNSQHDEKIVLQDLPYFIIRQFKSMQDKLEQFKVDYTACSGHLCPFKDDCSYYQGIQQAKEADIIIANHSLTLNWPRSIERPQYIVIDEAHKIEEEATKAFTLEFSHKDIDYTIKNFMQQLGSLLYLLNYEEAKDETIQFLRSEGASLVEILKDHAVGIADNIELFFKRGSRYSAQYWNELPMIRSAQANDELSMAIYNQFQSVAYVFDSLNKLILPYSDRWDMGQFQNEKNLLTAFSNFETLLTYLDSINSTLGILLEPVDNYSNSILFKEDMGYLFKVAPINVGELNFKMLLEASESVVFTSATLANSNGTCGTAGVEWMTGYSYLDPRRRFKSGIYLPEVFDYKNKANVYLATDVPAHYDIDFIPQTMQKVSQIIESIEGRTLLLFSARVRFEKAVEYLLEKFEGKIPLFIQGMGAQVVESFKSSDIGILIGMESFGEGIDIPGEALQFIYIDKVPDLRQDFVIQKRRDFYQANFGNEFNDYFLSHRTRSLHQKLGRLIRSTSDHGAVIITDARLKRWKSKTLESFKTLMLPYDIKIQPIDKSVESVISYFKG